MIRPIHAVVVAFAAVLFSGEFAHGDELKITDSDRKAARHFVKTVQEQHIVRKEIDRVVAGRILENYLNALDFERLYFTEADISEFNKRKFDLAEEIKEGDISIAFDIHNRKIQRMKEAEKLWDEFIKPNAHDFAAKEVAVVDPKARNYAKDAKVFREQWRLQLKLTLLRLKTSPDGKTSDMKKACEELSASYARMARVWYRTKPHQVVEQFLTSVGDMYDVGTGYTSAASVRESEAKLRGHFFGIGIAWRDGVVQEVFPDGPAWKAGLKTGDTIVSIGQGSSGAMVDITRMTMDEAIDLIRGAEGTTVRVELKRDGKLSQYSIVRGKVPYDNTKVETRTELVGPSKIGYLDVPNFYVDGASGTATEVAKHLQAFKASAVDVVVLDLRRCTGGQFDQATALSGLFVGKGPIVQTKNRNGDLTTISNTNTNAEWDKPVIVLVGRGTAAGAEIVVAAIKDHGRGIVVGDDTTYGSGLIRTRMNFPDGMGFAWVTTSQFYRVNGEAIHQRGIVPDVLIPSAAVISPRARSEFLRLRQPTEVPEPGLSADGDRGNTPCIEGGFSRSPPRIDGIQDAPGADRVGICADGQFGGTSEREGVPRTTGQGSEEHAAEIRSRKDRFPLEGGLHALRRLCAQAGEANRDSGCTY